MTSYDDRDSSGQAATLRHRRTNRRHAVTSLISCALLAWTFGSCSGGGAGSASTASDLRVEGNTNIVAHAPLGGPFPSTAERITLANPGDGIIGWMATPTAGWLTVTPSAGVLAAGQNVTVSIGIAHNHATILELGEHTAQVEIRDQEFVAGNPDSSSGVQRTTTGEETPSRILRVRLVIEPPSRPVRPATPAEAARFLHMATFGPREADITNLLSTTYEEWFEAQRELTPTQIRPLMEARRSAGMSNYSTHRVQAWRAAAVRGEDQLRQRMAFALSQILVCSDGPSGVTTTAEPMAEYSDILARNALGSYRQLLQEVTLSGAMGTYLSMVKNRRPDPLANIRADENYAREIMQLFSIGLHRLNMDGTPVLDASGQEIETYSQRDVEELARVFTGWSYANSTSFLWSLPHADPMRLHSTQHDATAATIVGGALIPGGADGQQRLELALDVIANHPNVAPFLARRLIQRFTTSNPSPAYVQRVALVFEDNGRGQRGDLFEVAKAVLLDPEVWYAPLPNAGKLREPVIRETALVRAFNGFTRRNEGPLELEFQSWLWFDYGQRPLQSPTVFNFYTPDHQPQGELGFAGLYAPEFQITTTHTITELNNTIYTWCFNRHSHASYTTDSHTLLDFTPWAHFALDPMTLVDRLSLLLASDQLGSESKESIASHITSIPMTRSGSNEPAGTERVREAVFLIASSPEASVLR
jgi:uncharacterized protein (DUF1800 family)